MVYDNDDEFGIDIFRNNFEYVFKKNALKVDLYKRVKGEDNPDDDDFLGVTRNEAKTEYYSEIFISFNSTNSSQEDLKQQGQDMAGTRILEGTALYNCPIDNGDIIEFVYDNPKYNIIKGKRFYLQLLDNGPRQGQYSFITFRAFSIEDDNRVTEDERDN